ncbi:MAG TPA: SDR family NAD(P)-dependent oxidoreductase [Euzebyales bacterium]|nr:SDR family NAD(P)-dependent oxidoreductase [Euzebyales bacterium]
MRLDDATFIVTGGGSGLGAATARALAAGGANVVLADVNVDAGTSTAAEIGDRARFVEADVTGEAGGQGAVEAAMETFGGVRGLVNCAGIATATRVVGRDAPQPLEEFTTVITVNLIGTFNMIRLAGAAMLTNEPNDAGERGVIVNTASVAAFDGQIGQAAYSASKGGVAAMTLPVAREFAQHGIRVVTIAPGIFDTPMMAGLPEKARESLGSQVPFPSRLGRPDEYAALAVHIVANEMLNGEVIRLDGAIRMTPR